MSLESRITKLERVEGGDTVYAFQLHDDHQQLIDMVALCGDLRAEHPMSLDEFDRRYAHMNRQIIQIQYVGAEDWHVHE